MGLRFRKSIRLGKGIRLNFSKKGVGLSVGVKGFRISSGPRGTHLTTSIPGTGISYTQKIGNAPRQSGLVYRPLMFTTPLHLYPPAQLAQAHQLRDLGISAIRSGNRAKGRDLLRSSVSACPYNYHAWLWLAEVAENEDERDYSVSHMLSLNPASQEHNKLSKLPFSYKFEPTTIMIIILSVLALVTCIIPTFF